MIFSLESKEWLDNLSVYKNINDFYKSSNYYFQEQDNLCSFMCWHFTFALMFVSTCKKFTLTIMGRPNSKKRVMGFIKGLEEISLFDQ